jgi:hypothetical protein
MNSIEKKETTALARPLSTLVPLIRKEIEAGDEAGIEHYRRAGEMLIEAKEQCEHGEWTAWVERNFHLGMNTARRYMQLADTIEKRPSGVFPSMHQAVRAGESRGPAWQAPVQRVVERVNMKALVSDEQNRAQEKRLLHTLAEQLIDIGYKVLAAKLHPDKGGSREAMARLNKVRELLKEAI